MKHHVDCMLHVASFFFTFFFIPCLSTQLFHFTLPLNHSPLRQTTAKQLLPVAVLRRSIFQFFFRVFSSVLEEYPNYVFVHKC